MNSVVIFIVILIVIIMTLVGFLFGLLLCKGESKVVGSVNNDFTEFTESRGTFSNYKDAEKRCDYLRLHGPACDSYSVVKKSKY